MPNPHDNPLKFLVGREGKYTGTNTAGEDMTWKFIVRAAYLTTKNFEVDVGKLPEGTWSTSMSGSTSSVCPEILMELSTGQMMKRDPAAEGVLFLPNMGDGWGEGEKHED